MRKLLFFAILLMAPAGWAHDLQSQVRVADGLVRVEATYEGSEPASFLAITVQPPRDAKPPLDAFQTGRTDLHGRFAFQPDRPGEWRITLDDELGHRVQTTVQVREADLAVAPGTNTALATSGVAEPASAPGRPSGERLLIGLSLIAGLSGLLYGWLAHKRLRRASA